MRLPFLSFLSLLLFLLSHLSSSPHAGPISATVHVSEGKSHGELLQSLEKLYTSSPLMKKYVDIHLVYDTFDRQFNMWRNVAKFFARTDVRPHSLFLPSLSSSTCSKLLPLFSCSTS